MGDDLTHARNAIRWAADDLLKATAHPETIYVQVFQCQLRICFTWISVIMLLLTYNGFQVGDPNLDHKCWERPEDMDTPRSVYKVDAQNPGSDVASETAAALAAASMVFKSTDRPYSQLLLQTAIRVAKL